MALAVLRRHRRWLYVLLWLVIGAFIILYIPAFQSGGDARGPGETLARVGDMPITVGEFRKAHLRLRRGYEQMYRGRLDDAALRNLGLEQQALEALVEERVVQLEARRLGLHVDDASVARELATSPEFQRDGRFVGPDEIRRVLQLQGVTEEEFEVSLRERMLRQRLESLVTDGVSVTPAEVEREYRRRNEQVKVEYALADAARFRATTTVAEADVKAYFDAHQADYKIPPRRVVSYLAVENEVLRGRIKVTDAEIEAYFKEHTDEFKQPEEACASHILVKVAETTDTKPAAAAAGHKDEDAKQIAEALLKEVAAGADFAELAKKRSEDQGSAASGGDLGCFPRGRMVPAFDTAAFELSAGQTSGLVKSNFGYHIIRMKERRDETVRPLGQVKDQINNQLLQQAVQAKATTIVEAASEALRRGRPLEEVATAQGLSVQKSAPLARTETADPISSPALLTRVFALTKGQVEAEPIATRKGQTFVRLDEIQDARAAEFKDVQEKVKADLLEQQTFAAALALAKQVKERAEKDGLDKAAAASGLVRKETPALVGRGQPLADLGAGEALEAAAFTLAEKALSEPVRTAAGYAVLRVLERRQFDAPAFEKQKDTLRAALREERKNQLFRSYLTQARERFPVEKQTGALKRVLG